MSKESEAIEKKISSFSLEFDKKLINLIPDSSHFSKRLFSAMKYVINVGGKRLRPLFLIEIAKMFKVNNISSFRTAASIELIHCYSLVHDDLPAMDNDDLRRGHPTCHKKFDDATAILVGDAFQALAFQILSDPKTHKNPKVRTDLISRLTVLSGHEGLAGGQSLDLLFEKKNVSLKEIVTMHEFKTAKLFEFCTVAPIIMSSKNNKKSLNDAIKFGKNFGLIFQAIDDLLDTYGVKKIMGKNISKDSKRNKGTILKYKTKDEVKTYCNDLAGKATKRSNLFKDDDFILNKLIFHVIDRVS